MTQQDDTTDDAISYEDALRDQADHLKRLRAQRGHPSLRMIEERAREQFAQERASLPIATQSAAFGGRYVGVDKLMLLVRTLMSWDEYGQECRPPDRRSPELDPWRERWTALTALRPTRRRATASPDATVGFHLRDEPWPPQELANSSAIRAVLHALRHGHRVMLPVLKTGGAGAVRAVAFSPDGCLLATGGDDQPCLWDPTTHRQVRPPLTGHLRAVGAAAFSPDGRLLATADHGGVVRLWDPTTGTSAATPLKHTDAVDTVAFSPDGSLLATVTRSGGVLRLWDPTTGTEADTPHKHTYSISVVAFSPDGLLVSGYHDGTVRMKGLAGGKIGDNFTGHSDVVVSVTFSPDGLLATASRDETVRLWDLTTRVQIGAPLTVPTDAVVSVTFSPDGHLLATVSDKGTVRLWDPNTREQIGPPFTGVVRAAAFSPDGSLLATGGDDGTVRFWTTLPAAVREGIQHTEAEQTEA